MGKHLNLSQRIIIESKLNDNISLRKIGEMIGKPHTTISREILLEEFYRKEIVLIISILLVKR